ncbi:Cadherin-22 [Crotalus adamanteus]|uniref:Cadherin-22 n=1 Tax=Crotalus adamanteus TaxID=8729 RepID=A0AAW1BTL1_CROAD
MPTSFPQGASRGRSQETGVHLHTPTLGRFGSSCLGAGSRELLTQRKKGVSSASDACGPPPCSQDSAVMVPHRPPGSGLLLLLLLLLCLLGGPDRLPAAQSLPGASGGPSPGAPGDGSLPGAGRVKRGWVWNQFFVVEEYTGTEPLYVGKVKAVGERETAPVLDSEPLQGDGGWAGGEMAWQPGKAVPLKAGSPGEDLALAASRGSLVTTSFPAAARTPKSPVRQPFPPRELQPPEATQPCRRRGCRQQSTGSPPPTSASWTGVAFPPISMPLPERGCQWSLAPAGLGGECSVLPSSRTELSPQLLHVEAAERERRKWRMGFPFPSTKRFLQCKVFSLGEGGRCRMPLPKASPKGASSSGPREAGRDLGGPGPLPHRLFSAGRSGSLNWLSALMESSASCSETVPSSSSGTLWDLPSIWPRRTESIWSLDGLHSSLFHSKKLPPVSLGGRGTAWRRGSPGHPTLGTRQRRVERERERLFNAWGKPSVRGPAPEPSARPERHSLGEVIWLRGRRSIQPTPTGLHWEGGSGKLGTPQTPRTGQD